MAKRLSIAPQIQFVLVYESEDEREEAFSALNSLGLDRRTQRQGEDAIRIFHAQSVNLVLPLQAADWSKGLISVVI